MHKWLTSHRDDLTVIQADLQSVNDAATKGDLDATWSACDDLDADVSVAFKAGYPPDANISTHYSSALAHFQLAAQSCKLGVNDRNGEFIGQAARDLREGAAELSLMTTAILKGAQTV